MTFAILALAVAVSPEPWAVPISAWIKVRPGAAVPALGSVELLAARGECEGFQVLARPPAAEVTISAPPLQGPGGGRLEVVLYREGYVPVRTPSNAQGAPGLWPDPLIPAALDHPEDRASTAERPLVFRGEVCVPASVPPGRYQGAVALGARGKPAASVQVAVDVQPFAIPATSSLPNSFGLSLHTIARGHRLPPEQARPLLWAYARELLRHRLSPYGLTMDGSEDDGGLRPFLDGTALPSGARFTTLDARGPLAAWTHRFSKRLATAQPFFYAKDEPRPEDVGLVLRQSAEARAAGLPVLVTSPYDERLAPAADILAPNLNCFFPRPGPQTCKTVLPAAALRARLRPGTKVWWYQSCSSHGCGGGPISQPEIERAYQGWASYMVDHPATLNRAMGPLAFLAGIDGELYFDTTHAYAAKGDPWEDVYAFGGNGDGTLFYPGRPDRLGGAAARPITSLRLQHIRDGLEDYEMLRMLARSEPELARRCVERLVRSGYEINPDPAEWDEVRRTIAAALSGKTPR
ncbi:MAG TPA: DUF4091 domain-containing protein [Myxococcales bacterium]|nr:DUF4091 domain-containing protein [Myxococcales bacterium]